MMANSKNILIGAVVVAILIVLAAYKFFYSSSIDDADKVQTEIQSLQARMDELNEKNANRSMYEAGISSSQEIIDSVLSVYGPGNTPEKTIMMVVDLCNKTGCSISDISFQDDSLIFENAAIGESGVKIYKSGMTVNILSGYTQLKKIMDYINSYPERMNVEGFSTSFDGQSGKLSTNMGVNFYSVEDSKHKYEEPVIEDINLGSPNIFKTAEAPAEEETEETSEEESTQENNTTEENNTGTSDSEVKTDEQKSND